MSWQLDPVFFNPNGPVVCRGAIVFDSTNVLHLQSNSRKVSFPKPDLSDEEEVAWRKICETFRLSLAIAPAVQGVGPQSTIAATRYRELEPLVEKFPNWPLVLALKAEVHFLLNDTYEGWVIMTKLKEIIGPSTDRMVDDAVDHLKELLGLNDEEEFLESTEDLAVKPYQRPTTFRFTGQVPYDVSQTRNRWTELKEQITTDVAIEHFCPSCRVNDQYS
ncbi:hypothetical protein HDU85_005034 [Gaertneriomyces sp. JEL0708]|nr:hypothetical protein HDU85_005034 [Gaertneriomyces sp. JEL0708]